MKNNEEIIIDGADVTQCEFYCGGLCNIPDSIETFDSCMDKNHNCYYKQLKRKEQELDKLKQILAEIEKLSIQGDVYCIDYNVNDCEKCIKQSGCKTTLFKQILQKINEVEND